MYYPIERSRIDRLNFSADRDLAGIVPISSGVSELRRRALREPMLAGPARPGDCRMLRDGLFPASKYPTPGESPGEGVLATMYPEKKWFDGDGTAPPVGMLAAGSWIVGAEARLDITTPAAGGTAVCLASTNIWNAKSVRKASFPALCKVARRSIPNDRTMFPSDRVDPGARGPPVFPSDIWPRAPLANS
jgi:hypothetical protein